MAVVVRVLFVTLMTTELEHDLKANPTLLYALPVTENAMFSLLTLSLVLVIE